MADRASQHSNNSQFITMDFFSRNYSYYTVRSQHHHHHHNES